MGRGTKWNGRKEEVKCEMYLNTIKIYRLYFRCSTCLNEITFKTDPKNSDYTVERGASRNFEPWKQAKKEEELQREKKERDEMGNEMKVLENRVEQSKREMAIQDAIEEQRERNARVAGITTDALLDIHIGIAAQLEEDQIEKAARDAFAAKKNPSNSDVKSFSSLATFDPSASSPFSVAAGSLFSVSSSSPQILKRLPDPVDPNDTDMIMSNSSGFTATVLSLSATTSSTAAAVSSSSSSSNTPSTSTATLPGTVLLKKRKKTEKEKAQPKEKKQKLKEQAAFCN